MAKKDARNKGRKNKWYQRIFNRYVIGVFLLILILGLGIVFYFLSPTWNTSEKLIWNSVDMVSTLMGLLSVLFSILIYLDLKSLLRHDEKKFTDEDYENSAAVFFHMTENGVIEEVKDELRKRDLYNDIFDKKFKRPEDLKITTNYFLTSEVDTDSDRVFVVGLNDKVKKEEYGTKKNKIDFTNIEAVDISNGFTVFLEQLRNGLKVNSIYKLHVFYAGPSALAIKIGEVFDNSGITLYRYHFERIPQTDNCLYIGLDINTNNIEFKQKKYEPTTRSESAENQKEEIIDESSSCNV